MRSHAKLRLRHSLEGLEFGRPKCLKIARDWPASNQRVTAIFNVCDAGNGLERGYRRTWTSEGVPAGRARQTPVAEIVRLFEASDGKTYWVGMNPKLKTGFVVAGTMRERWLFTLDNDQQLYQKLIIAITRATDD